MASGEAAAALLKGAAEWEAYQSRVPRPDLTNADLRSRDLRGRQFLNCDLSGARFDDSNLDGTSFADCDLSLASFANASLIGGIVDRCVAERLELGEIVLRDTRITGCVLRQLAAGGLRASALSVGNCTIEFADSDGLSIVGADLEDSDVRGLTGSVTLDRCVVRGGSLLDWHFEEGSITNSSFRDCDMAGWSMDRTALESLVVARCRVDGLTGIDSSADRLDLSGSLLSRVDVSCIGPATATLIGTSIVDSHWPSQRGRVTLLGSYVPSSSLLGHPVQDVSGLAPLMRREIADSQYLVQRLAKTRALHDRFGMRIWGLTTSYGQSLTRLTVCTALAIVVLGAVLLGIREWGAPGPMELSDLISSVSDAAGAFVGAGPNADTITDPWEGRTLGFCRLAGYFALGLWISIAAVRLGRLSSE